MTDSAIPSKRQRISVSLSTAASGLSDAIRLGGNTLSAIQLSTAWTSAGLTFQAALTSASTFMNVYNSTGGEIAYTVDANRLVSFDPAPWLSIEHIKVRSGTSGSPVAQAAERTIYLITQALGVVK